MLSNDIYLCFCFVKFSCGKCHYALKIQPIQKQTEQTRSIVEVKLSFPDLNVLFQAEELAIEIGAENVKFGKNSDEVEFIQV